MDEQMRAVLITGFGHMLLISRPDGAAFDTQVCFWIVGRGYQQRGRGNVIVGSPVDVVVTHVELLYPHPPQYLDSWNFAQPSRSTALPDSRKQMPAISADLLCHRLSFGRLFGQLVFLNAAIVALMPLGGHLAAQPVGHHDRQVIESGAQRF